MENGLTTLRVAHIATVAITTAIGVAVWIIFRAQLPPVVPWFYSQPWGEGQLVAQWWLLLAPLLGILVAAVFGIVSMLKVVERTLAAMTLAASIVIQLVLCLGLLRVILIVI